MSVFVDSSALVKRYADEANHEAVRTLLGPLAVSVLARVEVPAALWRKHRLGELSTDDVALLVSDFEADWFGAEPAGPAFAAVPVTDAILDGAALQVARHGLSAYDAVQLATAVAVRTVDPSVSALAAFDVALRAAAVREAFTLLPEHLD